MFGNKKVTKFAKVQEPEEEVEEEPEEELELDKPVPIAKPLQRKPVAVEEKKTATIVSAELIEGGFIRTVIVSKESLGEVGRTFELDEE